MIWCCENVKRIYVEFMWRFISRYQKTNGHRHTREYNNLKTLLHHMSQPRSDEAF